jgi:purine-binding chemotaxis protein CheW
MSTENRMSLHDLSNKGARKNKHLIFSLGELKFGIPLSQVKEIIGMMNITQIPDAPPFFRGIINLRGRVISVVDLKAKLALEKKSTDSKKPCILICEWGKTVLGSVVDDIVEVQGYEEHEIEHSIDIQDCLSREYITGVAKQREQDMVLLLDLARVLKVEELGHIVERAEEKAVEKVEEKAEEAASTDASLSISNAA